MMFADLDDVRRVCRSLPVVDGEVVARIGAREAVLTKPPGSLGRLEEMTAWLGGWQGTARPRLGAVQVVVFAGNHGVVAQGVSPYPSDVTAQMVGNFASGGAAINQLARVAGGRLDVVPVRDLAATADFTLGPAMDEAGFLAAVRCGAGAVGEGTDLLCVGEMGIGNTTAAAALCAALFGGSGADWAGRGTGLDEAGVMRKAEVIDRALALHGGGDALLCAMRLGGYELAAIFGAVLAARMRRIPVMLDGFVCTAAAAPLAVLAAGGLDHARVAHRSAEVGHARLVGALGQVPLLDWGLRLGEASGAALVVPLLRAALACHEGMASFAEAGVSNRA